MSNCKDLEVLRGRVDTLSDMLRKVCEAIEEYRENPDYGLKNTIYAVYDEAREVLDGRE